MEENSLTTSKQKESDFIKVQVQRRNHPLLHWPRLAGRQTLPRSGTILQGSCTSDTKQQGGHISQGEIRSFGPSVGSHWPLASW